MQLANRSNTFDERNPAVHGRCTVDGVNDVPRPCHPQILRIQDGFSRSLLLAGKAWRRDATEKRTPRLWAGHAVDLIDPVERGPQHL